MAFIQVRNLRKIFGPHRRDIAQAMRLAEAGSSKREILEATGCTVAIHDVSFEIERREVFVIMGLSGSGKSTLLRCFNRLTEPDAGEILVGDQNILAFREQALRTLRRQRFSMVFQHFGLLPHRSVLENVAFGLEVQGMARTQRRRHALRAIEQVGLTPYASARIHALSGGMRQRVGLARALAGNADALLMDEAFSALDPLIRTEMQDELVALQRELRKTIVFITHDLDEALKLGDRIAIMKDGRIVQIGTPEQIVMQPADDYVSAFVQNVDRSRVLTAGAIMQDDTEALVATAQPRIERDTPLHELLEPASQTHAPLAVLEKDGSLAGVITRSALLSAISSTRDSDASTEAQAGSGREEADG